MPPPAPASHEPTGPPRPPVLLTRIVHHPSAFFRVPLRYETARAILKGLDAFGSDDRDLDGWKSVREGTPDAGFSGRKFSTMVGPLLSHPSEIPASTSYTVEQFVRAYDRTGPNGKRILWSATVTDPRYPLPEGAEDEALAREAQTYPIEPSWIAEAALFTAPAAEIPSLIERIMAVDAGRAIRLIRDGARYYGHDDPARDVAALLSAECLEPLLTHADGPIRQQAITLLPQVGVARPGPGRGR